MKRLVMVLLFLAVLVGAPAIASAQSGSKAVLTVSAPLVVGGQTLKPGDYTFECKMIDGKDMLIVSAIKGGTELARVPCSPTPLDKKASANEIRTTMRDGAQALGSVRFKGEMVAHSVVS